MRQETNIITFMEVLDKTLHSPFFLSHSSVATWQKSKFSCHSSLSLPSNTSTLNLLVHLLFSWIWSHISMWALFIRCVHLKWNHKPLRCHVFDILQNAIKRPLHGKKVRESFPLQTKNRKLHYIKMHTVGLLQKSCKLWCSWPIVLFVALFIIHE